MTELDLNEPVVSGVTLEDIEPHLTQAGIDYKTLTVHELSKLGDRIAEGLYSQAEVVYDTAVSIIAAERDER